MIRFSFAVIAALGLAVLAGVLAGLVYSPSLREPAPSHPQAISHRLAHADVKRGERIARACAVCHTFEKGGANLLEGPNLWDIVGRGKASVEGFDYSGALRAQSGEVWTYDDLNAYLWDPDYLVPGGTMDFIGVRDAEDRAALIAWLRTLSDEPEPLPDAEDPAPSAESDRD
ncbi:MAG: cytochrome c family protein [Alphaproteobacteria bacterium]|nr:cytochrome c family protein [Alphaproteobacteria bacterium]